MITLSIIIVHLGKASEAEILLKNGVNPNIKDESGEY